MPLRELLGVYWTWRERFPSPRPRRGAYRSRELDADPAAQRYASELAELERKIRAGEDLTPHLSDRVATAYLSEQQRQKMPRSRDANRDRMLAAWGIHHLHLSNIQGRGGFNRRGCDLLYAIFQPDDAYLLGVDTHDDWERKRLVEVIVRRLADAGSVLEIQLRPGAHRSVHR